ncbi:thiol-disulfide isomerase/thioredoxin [Wenyingzhuangia heitensis]|uniref:Thiol-disulfide isomerase/thioredoxin n=1 Tax=Wenyingzhuangia heitensis TaxID=1487859 RepID=A0ABX0U9U4_9FLAO|nr:thioredoxin-like domain-containing protein [Wenyingzhuangia heitensis]NIJ45582.1 thiol-disulfide isomerase/thioredoxin [Wenyingzhuangia heitensis]
MKNSILVFFSLLVFSCKPPNNTQFTQKALQAPIITSSGTTISFKELIASYKGKTVVIDVWASWCVDCIKGLPKLKTIQQKYPKTSYVFISLDRNQQAWKNGINRYRIKGDHYYVEGGWKSIFAKNIDLDWIPRYIVIHPNSEVVVYRAIEADDSDIIEILENQK